MKWVETCAIFFTNNTADFFSFQPHVASSILTNTHNISFCYRGFHLFIKKILNIFFYIVSNYMLKIIILIRTYQTNTVIFHPKLKYYRAKKYIDWRTFIYCFALCSKFSVVTLDVSGDVGTRSRNACRQSRRCFLLQPNKKYRIKEL